MGILLRITLASIFIGFAIFDYTNPEPVKEYIDQRYKILYSRFIEETPLAKQIPGSLITSSSKMSRYITIGTLALTGVFALLGFEWLFKFLAVKFVLVAALLHIPCSTKTHHAKAEGAEPGAELNREEEIKKLMLLGSLFCAVLLYKSGCSKKKQPQKQ